MPRASYLCMCSGTCAYVWVCTHAHLEVRRWQWVSFSIALHLIFGVRVSYWASYHPESYRGPSCPQCWCYRYVPGFYTGAGDQTWVSYAVWLSHLKLVLTLTDQAISPAPCSCPHHLVGKHFSVADVLKTILTTVTVQPYRLIALSLLLKILLVVFIVYICL